MVEPIKPIGKKTYKLGLFGHPVAMSQSPKIHAQFAEQCGIDVVYELIDVTAEGLPEKFKTWIKTAHGCNITVPHKQNIMPLLVHYTERAHSAQAVNTVFWRDGELWGDNTDGDGLIMDLKTKAVQLKEAHVLIIGAGGATQGIIPSLLQSGVQHIDIHNRSIEKAQKLAKQFKRCTAGNDHSGAYDLIIHATSMGHHGLSPELQKSYFNTKTVVYDLSYGQAATPFLSAAKAHGTERIYDGLGMLYGQAALAFEIWFGQKLTIKLPSF